MGAFLAGDSGQATILRGVEVAGLQGGWPAQPARAALGLDDANLNQLSDLWGVNLVRTVVGADALAALAPDALAAALADLEAVAELLAQAHIYLLLGVSSPTATAAAPFPGSSTVTAWSAVASYFSASPTVLFEILPNAGAGVDVSAAVLGLVGLIRQAHPASLIVVGDGVTADLAALPLTFSDGSAAPNIVYAPAAPAGAAFTPDQEWAIGRLARSAPVMVTAWSGVDGVDDDRSAEAVAGALGRLGVGWSASSWNAAPRLVMDAVAGDFRLTRWGSTVRRALTFPPKLPLGSLLPDEA